MRIRSCVKAVLLWAILFSLLSCEVSKTTYATWTDMSQAPANLLGWIPPFLLEGTPMVGNVHNITECHDLDSNHIWGKAACSQDAVEWIRTLALGEENLAPVAQGRLSKLGLSSASALPYLESDWQLVLEGDVLYFYRQ